MFLQIWFLVVAASQIPQISSSTSSTTQHPAASPLLHKKSTPPVVYTAEKSRKEPFPSYSTPTVATNLGELYDEIKSEGTKQEPENNGFVEPLDFNSFLSDVGYKGKKSDTLPPLFASESNAKDSFADFFKSGPSSNNGRNSFVEPNFGGLTSSASDQKSRKHNNGQGGQEEEYGFVDPNVQFRSLFDSSETADGFRPQDFLGSKDDSAGVDPSKGSQTRALPQFTYTGRNGNNDRDDYESQPNNKYRSSYRQVDSRDRARGGDRDDNREDERPVDPYDDSTYYSGENDESPPAPPNPRNRYQNNNNNNNNNGYSHRQGSPSTNDESNQRYSPAVQESSHTPQASGSSKAAESGPGKGKCKRVEKEVDYNEDYAAYTDPEPDYDPSTYGQNDRYKRQAGGRGRQQQKSNKRPMTCYVCEDEQGRYAERCSYDSKGDPKGGNFFQSSSTSFGDNRRPGGRGGSDRYRRNPSLSASKSVKVVSTTTAASASSTAPTLRLPITTTPVTSSERDKRQSPNNGSDRNRGGGSGGRNNFDSDDYGVDSSEQQGGGGGGRGGRGGGGDRDRDFDDYSGEFDYNDGQRGSSNRDDDYSGPGSQRSPSHRDDDYGGPATTRGPPGGGGGRNHNNNNDQNNYGFGPPQRGSRGGRQEFDFGPPADFGRDAGSSASNNNDQGFNFDFSIPRGFEGDAQIGTSNTHNRPVFSGNNNNGNDFGAGFGNFDVGYDDYVKKYFPGAFGGGGNDGGGGGGGGGHSTPGPSPASTSYRPHGGGGPHHHSSSSPSPPLHRGHSPNKEHTQQSHNYAPPPYYRDDDHHGGGGGPGGPQFDKLMGAFTQRDRSGCQRYEKDGMTCYLCRDSRGMTKEDCMMAQGDPNGKNTRVAYHESTEYSSPPASVLPLPRSASLAAPTASTTVVKPVVAAEESKVNEKKKSPLDYDFDY